MRGNRIKLIYALIISMIVTVAGVPDAGVFASENIEIRTPEDLISLSEKSINEAATKDRNYVLINDIDLTGTEYEPIAIFAGFLDGRGHTISGFSFEGRQAGTGFVRTVTKDGHIMNLNLSGQVEPRGEMKETGGIAGVNYGLIESCSFEGSVLGFEITGGIAGHNMETGIIRRCTNRAVVNSTRRTGGITGFNEGLIESSENKGDINASRQTAHEMDDERGGEIENDEGYDEDDEENGFDKLIPDTIDLKDDDLFNKFDNGLKINYTGGIAGVCAGSITDSVNTGTVGYQHVGYKTGGITGYDRGIITGCKNAGKVYGRKDIGGIAGQFEPYAVNAYSEDSLSRAGDSLDELTDRAERLHKDFKAQDDVTQSHIDAVRSSSDDLRDTIKFYKEYYRCKDDSVEREIRVKVDNIRSIIDDIDLHGYDRETKEALQTLIDNNDGLYNILLAVGEARAAGIRPEMINYFKKIGDGIKNGYDAIDTLVNKAKRAGEDGRDLKDDLEDLRDAANDLDDYLRGCEDDYKKDFRITQDDIQSRTDLIAAEMDILSDGLKDSDSLIRKDVDSMVSSLNSLNEDLSGGYDEVQAELQKIYDTDSIHDVFDDISDDDDPSLEKGLLSDSSNLSDIKGDINAGGIAGTITDDFDAQSDFEVVSQGQVSLNYERTEKATILNCRNDGDVTVRNDYAGGIVGRADLGAVINSENYGRIEAENGDYAGGIAGKSAYVIRGCYSMSEAVSGKYAGGIAGIAHTLENNACLSAIDPEKEYHGAVAGDTDNADKDPKDKGSVSGNIFVFRGLGAINGVTEDREASAVTFEELYSMDNTPDFFGKMTVTFKDKGETVKKLRVPYGGTIVRSQYPEIADEEGKFGYWEDKDLRCVQQNTTVNAIYVDYITSIASSETERPEVILNGRFYEGTVLKINEKDTVDVSAPEGYDITMAVDTETMCEFGFPDNESYTVRFYMGDKKSKGSRILTEDNGVLKEAEHRQDGEYIVFSMSEPGTFYLAKAKEDEIRDKAKIALAAAAGLIIVLLIIWGLMKKKKQQRDPENGRK